MWWTQQHNEIDSIMTFASFEFFSRCHRSVRIKIKHCHYYFIIVGVGGGRALRQTHKGRPPKLKSNHDRFWRLVFNVNLMYGALMRPKRTADGCVRPAPITKIDWTENMKTKRWHIYLLVSLTLSDAFFDSAVHLSADWRRKALQ